MENNLCKPHSQSLLWNNLLQTCLDDVTGSAGLAVSLDLHAAHGRPLCTFTCIQYALGQNGAKFGHDVIVLVIDDFGIQLPELIHLRKQGGELESLHLSCR